MPQVETAHRDGVAVITLSDPDRRNALNVELCDELTAAVDAAEADTSVGAIVVTGAGKAFCAGANLAELGASRREGLERIYSGFLRVASSSLPTVAAVNGAAVGAGMNLALACDVRVVARKARFDTRFVDLGIHPGGGHTWMLRRIVGQQTAAAMVLFGEVLDGEAAARVGLAWRCVDDGALLDEAVGLAAHAASCPRDLVAKVKATLATMAGVDSHEAAVAVELEPQLWSMDQPAFAERLAQIQARISGSSR